MFFIGMVVWIVLAVVYLGGLAMLTWLVGYFARTVGRGSMSHRCGLAMLLAFLFAPCLAAILYLPWSFLAGEEAVMTKPRLVQEPSSAFLGAWTVVLVLAFLLIPSFQRRFGRTPPTP